ncbi:heme ABC transporter ATP-binding protein [Stutzerimonas stutzeri]|uniref:heme ABC transporter ATP-binding protein n=1 Tax=Stutzerimonas sp. S1 TaxID=3030652 RepID=UPI0022259890|nr:heme ABC transporter ATP-binding protein [Stutzerimonas sp. S1]MCW3150706.1 heme ABC transporter ATP-binding protein [Stutzerimonas sp. S1]
MLSAEGLVVRRGGRLVLQNIDLQVPRGHVFGVLGPNGAGKSSLLSALSGELAPASGQVLLHGRRMASWGARERARSLAVLPQTSTLSFAFRVDEVVAMGRLPHDSGREADERIITEALTAADALHLRLRTYLELSGGERQRVHLARVLTQLWPGREGQVLLLDEPTSMLDPAHQHAILQVLRDFAERGGAVLVILHDLNLAARYCDRLLLLADGIAQANGTPQEVLQADLLRAVFGLEVLVQRHPERNHPLIIAR